DVLATGRRRIEIVDHHDHAVVLVVDGVGDAGGQPVVPEAAVAHDRDRLLVGLDVEGRRRRRTETVSHGSTADVEGWKCGEQMTADVASDLMRAEFPLHKLHRGKDRPLRAADAEARGWRRLRFGQLFDSGISQYGRRVRRWR